MNRLPTSVARRGRTASALLCALALAACGGATTPTAGPDTWATVDDHAISRDEVDKAYRRAIDPTPTPPSDEEVLTVKLRIIDELVNQEILLAKARALKIEVTDAEVETAYADRKRNVSDEAFQQQLNQRSLTADDMKQGVRRELIVQKLIDRDITSKVAVTDQEIGDFYNNNRGQFNVPETQYRIAQIIITPMKDTQLRNRLNDDATTPADAARKAQMLMEKLRGGAEFGALAMDYSEDPQTAPQGGDLGFIPLSALKQVPAQLRDLVLRMEPGTVNTVSAGGAHTLVLLAAREAAGQRELSNPSVRDGIRDILRQRKEQLLRGAYIAAARNGVRIVNNLARQITESGGKVPGLGITAPGK